ncbi:DUF4280 domain-containing protein [Apibacter muscae]|uniref:DUF4280 domain-containing protein n=1 Tax=Apibacter muscae TaxID=2509004 RepID=UPI0011AD3A62|nr:DUF4280 domain-containing protein [Apibacter muscae]TWP27665.1 DUF4280 domain-containing protein [Apibacter muscae]
MSHPIIQDTQLECSQGTKPTPIQITSQSFVCIAGKLQATEADKEATTNIIPFGLCKLKPIPGGFLPCQPALIKWQNTSVFTIDGKQELTTDSFCICSTGGKITPKIDANSSFENIK